jgi:hypothetical protein
MDMGVMVLEDAASASQIVKAMRSALMAIVQLPKSI